LQRTGAQMWFSSAQSFAPMKAELLFYPLADPPYVYFQVGEPAYWEDHQEEQEAADDDLEEDRDEGEDQRLS
jgi:hypothetical protein